MRSHHGRPTTVASRIPRPSRPQRGFSMVELLVTDRASPASSSRPWCPCFANALKETSRDNFRVTATNIAQDRIEKIRMLNFADITAANLNSSELRRQRSSAPASRPSAASSTRSRTTSSSTPRSTRRSRSRSAGAAAASDSTTVQTVVMDPAPVTTGSTPTPSATPSPHSTTGTNYTLMVSVTDDDVDTTVWRQGRPHRRHAQRRSRPRPCRSPTATNALTCSWT